MNAILSHFRLMLCVAAGVLALSASASAEPTVGREYSLLSNPQKAETPGKIEVLEFFSYGCPHCNDFHPLISEWASKLPSNVAFVRVPVSFGRPQWGALVRAYYTLQSTGDLARLDSALFDALHKERKPLFDEASLTAWAAANGVPADKFKETYESFNVSTRASHAEQLSRNYNVQGVPHVVIDGKYEILGSNFNDVLKNASAVLDMINKKE